MRSQYIKQLTTQTKIAAVDHTTYIMFTNHTAISNVMSIRGEGSVPH